MSEFNFSCPFCSKKIKANTAAIGKMARCPECGSTFRIPYAQGGNTMEFEPSVSTTKLIYCKTCGKQISANALSCPGCGEPNDHAPRNNARSHLAYILLALFFGAWCIHDYYAGYKKIAKFKFLFMTIPTLILIGIDAVAYCFYKPGDYYHFKPFDPPIHPYIIWGVFIFSCGVTGLYAIYQIFTTDKDADGQPFK